MSYSRYLCLFAYIVLCFRFVFLLLVYPMLPVSVDCQFLAAPSVFSNVYFALHNPDYSVGLLQRRHLNHLIIVAAMVFRRLTKSLTRSFCLLMLSNIITIIAPLKAIITPV